MEDCIFCKIIKGEIPCFKIYEDEFTFAFLDIAKDLDGHILVVPKKHCKDVLECEEEDLKNVMCAIQKIGNHLVSNCGYDGINLLNCCGESAGQSVFHFHMHILPRNAQDGEKVFGKFSGAKLELEEVWAKLKMN